jgi:hypothetical protein
MLTYADVCLAVSELKELRVTCAELSVKHTAAQVTIAALREANSRLVANSAMSEQNVVGPEI